MTRKLVYLSITLALAGTGTGHSASPSRGEIPGEFLEIAEKALPPEIQDLGRNAELVKKLLNPDIAQPQISGGFKPLAALRAVDPRGKLVPDPRCFLKNLPGKDPAAVNEDCTMRSGERSGVGPASELRFNLFSGRIAYLNRGRSFDFGKSPENQVKEEDAAKFAQGIAQNFGIPGAEWDLQHMSVRSLIGEGTLPGAPLIGDNAAVQKRAEVHVYIPRHVGGIPVEGSDMHLAVGDAGNGSPMVARMHTNWTDFRMLPGLDAGATYDRSDLVGLLASALAESHVPGHIDPGAVRGRIAYVQASALEGIQCTDSQDEADVATLLPARPQDMERMYVPAVMVAIPPQDRGEYEGSEAISTAPSLHAFPLLDVEKALCGDGSV